MKKLNEKGFVISTVLYTLVIMVFLIVVLLMSLMSATRRNTRNLTETIEDELNRYSETKTEIAFQADGSTQTYIVPYGQAGWYRIQLWGGAGGSIYNSDGSIASKGGAGGYTSGVVYLEENTYVNFVIGGTGSSNGTAGKPNGGTGGGTSDKGGSGGGGASTVSIGNDYIMIAGGGGGASKNAPGGAGGGLIGGSGNLSATDSTLTISTGGSQSIGGKDASNNQSGGSLMGGSAQNNKGAGGGGGYYGGGAGSAATAVVSGAGGSSYIKGYAETNSVNQAYHILNPIMIAGTNDSVGGASIELISTTEPLPKNNTLKNVRYIKDCNSNNEWSEIQVITTSGKNIAYGRLTSAAQKNITDGSIDTPVKLTTSCITVDLGAVHNDIAEIAIWHNPNNESIENRISKNHTVSVSNNNSSWQVLKSSVNNEVPQDSTGVRFSIWQYATEHNRMSSSSSGIVTNLPSGNYYIISALGKNQALEAVSNNEINNGENATEKRFNGTVRLNNFNGKDTQKWTIEKVDDGYRIVESDSQYAMQAVDSLSQAGSRVNTSSSYGADYGWTKWQIKTAGDGTFFIYPIVQKTPGVITTYLSVATQAWYTNSFMQLSNKNENSYSERFYLINVD